MNDDNRIIVQDIMDDICARAATVSACANGLSDECVRIAMGEFIVAVRECASIFEEMEGER